MPNYNYKSYMANLNRVRFVELIDNCHAELRMSSFRASLVANPVTGLAYDARASVNDQMAPAAAA